MHEIVYSVAGGVGRLGSHLAGQPVRLDFPGVSQPVSVAVTLESGAVKRFTSRSDGSSNFVVVDETLDPGVYPCELSGGKTGPDAFVVNPDPAEADVARVGPDELAKCFPPGRLYVVGSQVELADALQRIQGGVSLTSALFLIVIAIAVVELFVSNRTRPAPVDDAGIRPFASRPGQESAS